MNAPTTSGANHWAGAQFLPRLYALNEHCLEVIAQRTREATTLDGINRPRALWRDLNRTARQRAAVCPVLLVNVQFQSEEWWRSVRDVRSRYRPRWTPPQFFSPKISGELMRETLMLAWSVVGAHRIEAGFMLGMTPSVSTIVADLTPRDVERIAARYSAFLQPRWMDVPHFWKRLLQAAIAGNEDMLSEVRLHSIQLLGSELMPMLKTSAA